MAFQKPVLIRLHIAAMRFLGLHRASPNVSVFRPFRTARLEIIIAFFYKMAFQKPDTDSILLAAVRYLNDSRSLLYVAISVHKKIIIFLKKMLVWYSLHFLNPLFYHLKP
jgi:hypothetical protein